MGQAKGILPRGAEGEPISDPRSSGYLIAVGLDPNLDRTGMQALLTQMIDAVAALVARNLETGERVAAVAVGFGPSFFQRGAAFNPPLQVPAAFAPGANPLPSVPGSAINGEMFFYVVSIVEARVSAFVSTLWALRPAVQTIEIERGYQRTDGTEPFGYRDGLRNPARPERPEVVFVDGDRHFEEPHGAIGGSYMTVMKIRQNFDAFSALAPDQQDAVIGRERDGTRLDLVAQKTAPRDETSEPVPAMTQSAHVAKAGPRGRHDDTKIFRRGLPFFDAEGGQIGGGLQFCSFQASLDQFDVIWGDWMMNPQFSAQGGGAPGIDALLDPGRGLTTIEKFGYFFVPPQDPEARFIGATLFDAPPTPKPKKTGRVAIRKRVVSSVDATARFERGGFTFEIHDTGGQVVATLTTDSAGHAVSGELPMGANYTLHETGAPQIPNLQPLADISFTLDTPQKVIPVVNQVTQPGGYGS